MKAEATPLMKLFDTLNKGYVIPGYQRPFAWDPFKATDLLDSIREDSMSNPQVPITSLGTLLFSPIKVNGTHPFGNSSQTSKAPSTVWEVVDGQQRMTVLALIGYALQKRFAALSQQGLQYNPPLEFENLYATRRRLATVPVPVLIRDGDNFDSGLVSDLAKLLNSFNGQGPVPPNVGERLRDALKAITEWTEQYLVAGNFEQFSTYFLNKCEVIQVLADDQDVAFRMFEPLNSTSEPLTAFEVYRSKVTRHLQPIPSFNQVERLLDYRNSRRDEVTTRSNTLVFNEAQVYSGERPRVQFVPLKQYLDKQVTSPFVSALETGAGFFKDVWLSQDFQQAWFDKEIKNCVRFLRASKHDIALLVLLRYFMNSPQDVAKASKIVVAFYALWRASFPTNKLPEAYRNLFERGTPTQPNANNMAVDGGTLKSITDLAAYFRSRLADRLSPNGLATTSAQLFAIWSSDDYQKYLNYVDLKTICRLFIFLEMGSSLKSNLVPDDPWSAVDDIDHVIPQAAGTDPATEAKRHKLGNLTFLPPTVNKSVQAMGWDRKRQVYGALANHTKNQPMQYADGSALPGAVVSFLSDPNTPALMYLQSLANVQNFDDAELAKRTQEMLKAAWTVLWDGWLHLT